MDNVDRLIFGFGGGSILLFGIAMLIGGVSLGWVPTIGGIILVGGSIFADR